jgi:hypothetical protein
VVRSAGHGARLRLRVLKLVVVLLASDDLGRRRRVEAKPLRSRFASLDPRQRPREEHLRGGRERFSGRRSAVRSVNGFVNATRRNRPSQARRGTSEETDNLLRPTSPWPGEMARATAEAGVALLIT